MQKNNSVRRSLKRHGRVCYANDINEALFLMAEKDFDYYFIDADVPHAQAFLKHLEHDPQLAPPRGVVLLTDNEEEDCEAWSADTFITKSKIYDDLPYIFSHLRGNQSGTADVVRIAPDLVEESDATPHKVTSRRPYVKERAGTARSASEKDRPFAFPEQAEQNQEHRGVDRGVSHAENGQGRRLRLVAAALLVVIAGLWLFVWGPFGKNSAGQRSKISGRKSVEAETSDSTGIKNELIDSRDVKGSATIVQPEKSPATQSAAAVPDDSNSQPITPVPIPLPATVPTPLSEPANHAPTVSISGPTTVKARETATYTAVASDSDGDQMTYSWGSSSKSTAWSTPGLYLVSVTVTDSHGASASESINVRVI